MPNAIEMLRKDHGNVKKLFEEFEHAKDSGVKQQIVETTIRELETHSILEQEIFYPAAEEDIGDKALIDEAREEHQLFKLVMTGLKKISAGGKGLDAKYRVLSESVTSHIEEEETEIFPKLEDKINAEALGARMESRKEELIQRASRKRRAESRSRRVTKASPKGSNKGRRRAFGRDARIGVGYD
jgi:iron-sulfur cluster repair protein YtfE (RIC family)